MKTAQIDRWAGDFGREYTDRNSVSLQELDSLYEGYYGVTRSQLNERFLAEIPPDARILEVGCNRGNQLVLLQQMGFRNLYGIEVQKYALEQARSRLKDVQLTLATAFEIPYADRYFDLVFTSGVLIHIAPGDLPKALAEIHRCTNSYIWGHEYHAPELTEINYRGPRGLLWKTNYVGLYLKQFDDLELQQQEFLPYREDANVDCMFLLRKKFKT